MEKAYRLGELMNVLLVGVLIGVTLYSTIRHAEAYEAERNLNPVRVVRPAPRAALRGIDAGPGACGWVLASKATALGYR